MSRDVGEPEMHDIPGYDGFAMNFPVFSLVWPDSSPYFVPTTDGERIVVLFTDADAMLIYAERTGLLGSTLAEPLLHGNAVARFLREAQAGGPVVVMCDPVDHAFGRIYNEWTGDQLIAALYRPGAG